MTSKHTPGPWTQSKIIPTAVDDALNFIVDCRVIDDDIETAIANARLIAASPDLLKELRRVMTWIDNWSPEFSNDPDWPADRDSARAAIAKATGEAT